MDILRRLFGKKQARAAKKYASLDEEIDDLQHLYRGKHPSLSDEAWVKESIRSAREAESSSKNDEATEHWKRVAALAEGRQQKAFSVAIAHIQEIQNLETETDWEVIAARAARFAKEAEKHGRAEEAVKHWRRVTMLAPKGSDLWNKAMDRL